MEPNTLASKLAELDQANRDYKDAIQLAETYRKRREELKRELLTEVPALRNLLSVGGGKPDKGSAAAVARVARIQSPVVRQKAHDSLARNAAKRSDDTMAVVQKLGGRCSVRQVREAMGIADAAAYKRLMLLVQNGKLFRIPNRYDQRGRPYVFMDERHLHALPKQEQDEARHASHRLKDGATEA